MENLCDDIKDSKYLAFLKSKMAIAKDTGFTRQSGRWEYPLWVFDEKFLRRSGEEAYDKYSE